MKYLIIATIILLTSCNSHVKDGYRYKKSVVTICKECVSGENGFFISFKKPLIGRVENIKGMSKYKPYDKYTCYTVISKAYNEKRVIKTIIKRAKQNIK